SLQNFASAVRHRLSGATPFPCCRETQFIRHNPIPMLPGKPDPPITRGRVSRQLAIMLRVRGPYSGSEPCEMELRHRRPGPLLRAADWAGAHRGFTRFGVVN